MTLPKFNVVGVEGVYISAGDDEESRNEIGGQTSGQTSGQTTIDEVFRLIRENPNITRKSLSETLGIATSAVQKHINHLKSEGIIRRVGGDFGGYWEITK